MRTFITAGVSLAFLLNLGLGVRPAAAQMMETVTVNLPFAANVGSTTLPAGQYTIRDLKDDGSSSILEFISLKGPSVSTLVNQVETPGDKPADRTEVIVRSDGEKKYIEKIFVQGHEYGFELVK